MKLYSYNQGSASAKALSEALGIRRLNHVGRPVYDHRVINWGASNIKRALIGCPIFNQPHSVASASNKLEAFKAMAAHGVVPLPDWSDNPEHGIDWLDQGDSVVCRLKLNGHSGEGIEIRSPDPTGNGDHGVPDAPLYTKYIKKNNEYRVHVCQGDAFFIQRKARKLDVPDDQVNWQVRNHQNGFIYANQNVEVSQAIIAYAINAVEALGLDFGAVDVIEKKDGSCYVLEVNTAPGLSGATLEAYVNKFKEIV